MSATLRVSDFAENKTLFPSPPPVINVAARQHPVTIHFSRRTYPDYVTQAIKKASKIHTRLPPGGILIFLTGQAEIVGVCRRLEAKFSKKAIEEKKRRQASRSWPTMRIDDGPSEYASTKTVNPAQGEYMPVCIALPVLIKFQPTLKWKKWNLVMVQRTILLQMSMKT